METDAALVAEPDTNNVNKETPDTDHVTLDNGGVTMEMPNKAQIRAIVCNWNEVCGDIRNNGIDLFISFFRAFPAYQEYFSDFRGISLQDLRSHKKIRLHATRVMHALSSMVTSLDEPELVLGIMGKTVDAHFRLEKIKVKSSIQYQDLFSVLPDFLSRKAAETYDVTAQEGWARLIKTLTDTANHRVQLLQKQIE